MLSLAHHKLVITYGLLLEYAVQFVERLLFLLQYLKQPQRQIVSGNEYHRELI